MSAVFMVVKEGQINENAAYVFCEKSSANSMDYGGGTYSFSINL